MSAIPLIMFVSILYLIPAGIISLIIWGIGRKRAGWLNNEFIFIIIPVMVWPLLTYFGHRPKSLSNIVEVVYSGLAGGFILLPRLFIPAVSRQRKIQITVLSTIFVSIVILLIWFLVPILPE